MQISFEMEEISQFETLKILRDLNYPIDAFEFSISMYKKDIEDINNNCDCQKINLKKMKSNLENIQDDYQELDETLN